MKFFDYLDKIEKFNKLIERGCTGTPDEFSEQLNISRTSLYDFIDELRSRNIEVGYSRTKRTFFYKNPVSLEIHFIIKNIEPITNDEIKNITGGYNFFTSVLFGGRKHANFAVE